MMKTLDDMEALLRERLGSDDWNAVQALLVKLRATLASAPAGAGEGAMDLSAWEKARFGVFHPDGRFEELPVEGWESHPLAHTARWVGGIQDMQLLRAALAGEPAVAAPIEGKPAKGTTA